MKQATLVAPKKFEIREVNVPEPTPTQALLKIHAVGICGSDIHAYYGLHPFISCPIVMGHEATGEVIKVGSAVTEVKAGDRVIIRPQVICNDCLFCKTNRYHICKNLKVLGCQETGACSDYYAVESNILYKLPDNIDYAPGTVIEPLAVGVHAVKRGTPDGVAGKKVLVIGAGTIGNMVAQAAKGLGAATVMITDISPFKLGLAEKCGIDHMVNVKEQDLQEVLLREYGEYGADVIYECTASDAGINQALEVARKGSTIVIVGVYERPATVNMGLVQDREFSLVGTLMYLHEDYVDAIELVKQNKVFLQEVITDSFKLEDIDKAYKHIEAHRDNVQKVILTF